MEYIRNIPLCPTPSIPTTSPLLGQGLPLDRGRSESTDSLPSLPPAAFSNLCQIRLHQYIVFNLQFNPLKQTTRLLNWKLSTKSGKDAYLWQVEKTHCKAVWLSSSSLHWAGPSRSLCHFLWVGYVWDTSCRLVGRFYNWSHPLVMAPTHPPSLCIATAVNLNISHLPSFPFCQKKSWTSTCIQAKIMIWPNSSGNLILLT